jgi:SPP1 gp7 family putative phage head morphogenesis protein
MHDHSHSPTRREARLQQLSGDPTNTVGIRQQFLREVRQLFETFRGRIRRLVGYEEDRFNLRQNGRLAEPEDIERFPTDEQKVRVFTEWLRDWLRQNVLQAIPRGGVINGEHWTAQYIRSSYRQGWEDTTERLEEAGVPVAVVEDIFAQGVPKQQLADLYTRTYDNLESVTTDAVPVVRKMLSAGLAEGVNPREMARRLTNEIETLQKTQAEVLARTEVINSYSTASLSRFDRAGQSEVKVSGEFATADDQRVCPICEALEGETYSTGAMREETFEFDAEESDHPDAVPSLSGEYRVQPPVHPQCRCAILPVIQ